jgi:hypothetical protein
MFSEKSVHAILKPCARRATSNKSNLPWINPKHRSINNYKCICWTAFRYTCLAFPMIRWSFRIHKMTQYLCKRNTVSDFEAFWVHGLYLLIGLSCLGWIVFAMYFDSGFAGASFIFWYRIHYRWNMVSAAPPGAFIWKWGQTRATYHSDKW